jgi:hypothetical protein
MDMYDYAGLFWIIAVSLVAIFSWRAIQ